MESFKTIHIWKADGISNQENNVSICGKFGAAPQNPRWRPICQVSANNSGTVNILIYVCYTNLVEHKILNNLI